MMLLRNCSALRNNILRSQHTQVHLWKNIKTYKEIPGPSVFKLVIQSSLPGGQYHKLQFSDLMKKFREEYGPIVKLPGAFGKKDAVIVFSADDIEKVFRADGKRPIRRVLESFEFFRANYRQDIFKDAPGLGTSQGEKWYNFRSKVNEPLMQPKTTKLYVPKIDEVAQDFVKKIREIRNNKDELPEDFYDNLNDFALESIAVISLDKRLGVIDDSSGNKLSQLVKNMLISMYELDFEPSIWRYFKTPGFKKAMRNYEELTEMVNTLVTEAINNRKEIELNGDNEGVLDKLLKIDKNVAIVMVQDLLAAGIESTAMTAATIFYCLAKNPNKQDNLRQEIFKLLPERHSNLTASSLSNIPYLRACIKEAMRIFFTAPANLRCLHQDLLLQGYKIPKDTDVIMPGITSTDEQYFKRATEFIPERWLKDNTDPGCPHATDSHPYAFLPFGHGPRMCVGRRLGELELQVLTARILREFKLEWHYPELKFKCSVFNAPADPLRFEFSDIK